MKLLANIEKMKIQSLLLLLMGTMAVSCSNILDEEVEDCSVEYRVKFKYDHNMKFAGLLFLFMRRMVFSLYKKKMMKILQRVSCFSIYPIIKTN